MSRTLRHIRNAIENLDLDLTGLTVLTEAASGAFRVTSVIAAMANARRVVAIGRDSRWGSFGAVKEEIQLLSREADLEDRIDVIDGSAKEAGQCLGFDLITNLGFVRPITAEIIQKMPRHGAISLMWEPWEFRDGDIDLVACRDYQIPIIGTNEGHPAIATMDFLGLLAVKLLLEVGFEIKGLRTMVIGTDPFGKACCRAIEKLGGETNQMSPRRNWTDRDNDLSVDAIVVAEHRWKGEILGPSTERLFGSMLERKIPIIHICGGLDSRYLEKKGCPQHPPSNVEPGYMVTTTAHVGEKPVVDLHAGGLKAGSIVVNQRKRGMSVTDAVQESVNSGYGLVNSLISIIG
jgi:hypothetical protein